MDLLLLPGLLCDEASWAGVGARLAGIARCRVAGYGDAGSLEAMARRALEGVPERFALAGHSMGARVACEVLRVAPQRVTHLALFDTGHAGAPTGAAWEAERDRRLALVEIARTQGMRALAHAWMPPMVHAARLADEELVDAIVAMVERSTPERFAAQVDALLRRPRVDGVLRSVRVPALVGCGREDGWSPLQQHDEIAALLPGSRLVVFEDCGHMAPMERPADVAAALRSLLCGPAGRDASATRTESVAGT
jgi:pimeloyl-ACP methyl ester carboxylesterase